jgi:hypothetical protein
MEVRELLPIAIAFVIVAIAISIGSDVLDNIQTSQIANQNLSNYNISGKGLLGLSKIANWLPTIGIVIGASVVIGTLITYFAGASR